MWTAALLALTLVGSGIYLASREGPRSDPPAPASARDERAEAPSDPDGFRVLPPLSETRRTSFTAPADVIEADARRYQARLHTSAGTLRVALHARRAPRTVNNFVFLALHRFYDGVPFHRVLDGFMAQTGDPTGTGSGGPGYTIEDEFDPALRHDRAGVLSMANRGPDTGGSQFFVTFAATPWLDDRHAVFGEVVEGMEVLDRLARVDPSAPEAVLRLADPAADLEAVGMTPAAGADTVEAALRAHLGAPPVQGQSFALAGKRAVVGRADGGTAVALYPQPDVLERVEVLVAPRAPEADAADAP